MGPRQSTPHPEVLFTSTQHACYQRPVSVQLERVNENRRTLYHLQAFETPTGLWRRAISRADNPVTKDDVAQAIPGMLRQEALEALACAFTVRTIEVERRWR